MRHFISNYFGNFSGKPSGIFFSFLQNPSFSNSFMNFSGIVIDKSLGHSLGNFSSIYFCYTIYLGIPWAILIGISLKLSSDVSQTPLLFPLIISQAIFRNFLCIFSFFFLWQFQRFSAPMEIYTAIPFPVFFCSFRNRNSSGVTAAISTGSF